MVANIRSLAVETTEDRRPVCFRAQRLRVQHPELCQLRWSGQPAAGGAERHRRNSERHHHDGTLDQSHRSGLGLVLAGRAATDSVRNQADLLISAHFLLMRCRDVACYVSVTNPDVTSYV